MTRRNKPHGRCPRCALREVLCLCDLIPTIETRTRVVLVAHMFELRKPTNTGRLAMDCLARGRVVTRGLPDVPDPRLAIEEGTVPLLLFPHEDAEPIGDVAPSIRAPVTLVVPDGTWAQARRVRNRMPELEGVRAVRVDDPKVFERPLRRAEAEHACCTMEAVAHALRALDGAEVAAGLLWVLRAMIERTLWLRGRMKTEEVAAGIPAAALAHDPRGPVSQRKGRGDET